MPKIGVCKSDFGRRLRLARLRRGLTQAELASLVGLKQSLISKYETGTRTPEFSLVQQLAAVLNVPVSYFSGEVGLPESIPQARRIPLFGKVPAGDWSEASPSDAYTYFDLESLVRHADYALIVEGDSMYPNIKPGDIVLVQSTPDFIHGEVVIVRSHTGEVSLKRVVKQAGTHLLKPDNPQYSSLSPLNSTILGTVVALIRRKP